MAGVKTGTGRPLGFPILRFVPPTPRSAIVGNSRFKSVEESASLSVRALKEGAIEFLCKPFRDQDLLDAIQFGIQRERARRVEADLTSALRERHRSLTARER